MRTRVHIETRACDQSQRAVGDGGGQRIRDDKPGRIASGAGRSGRTSLIAIPSYGEARLFLAIQVPPGPDRHREEALTLIVDDSCEGPTILG